MIVDRSREVLINAIIYFTKNTKSCNKLKLFKLLYFLDVEHFKITGRTVTGLEYFAWPMGPVPVSLFDELNSPKADFKSSLSIIPQAFLDKDFSAIPPSKALKITPKKQFNDKIFSKRQFKIMQKLSEIYKDANANQMTEISHAKNQPWDIVYNQQKNKQQKIDLRLALDEKSVSKEFVEEIIQEDNLARALFK